jgi:hypothetical protein
MSVSSVQFNNDFRSRCSNRSTGHLNTGPCFFRALWDGVPVRKGHSIPVIVRAMPAKSEISRCLAPKRERTWVASDLPLRIRPRMA